MFKCCRKPEYADTYLPQPRDEQKPVGQATPAAQQDDEQPSSTDHMANHEDISKSEDVPANNFLSFGQQKFNNLQLEVEDTNSQVLLTTQTTEQNKESSHDSHRLHDIQEDQPEQEEAHESEEEVYQPFIQVLTPSAKNGQRGRFDIQAAKSTVSTQQ